MAKVAYEPGLNPLPSAVRDVEAVCEVLLHTEMGGFAASDITLLKNQDEFISIDELHEYASQKVRELQSAMKPEIYAIREGFKIRLAKVAPGDPRQRYCKEVARFIHRGEISLVGRRTLDYQRTRLGLKTTEAKAIKDDILEPYRNEFREKLQQYQRVFTELLEQDETITDSDRHELQNLQQILGLRNEDTISIEALVTARFKTHEQNLQIYQQEFTTALRQEFPLSTANPAAIRTYGWRYCRD
ncbi:hypothetical protein [Nostoc sp. 'Lobaria pulmonaria (5183) cyanobiont']|uniref:hypothetical protein n=1 Tax=Nostoc sp. 'Lobaria pulmonaria (5183) cyanobiont' TaxID=1618022 RepID=UPI000CF35F45|nr:hypothetical protein [Nostoc sp. 'Lobaria pulmonaria (5183) cyanobiont']